MKQDRSTKTHQSVLVDQQRLLEEKKKNQNHVQKCTFKFIYVCVCILTRVFGKYLFVTMRASASVFGYMYFCLFLSLFVCMQNSKSESKYLST